MEHCGVATVADATHDHRPEIDGLRALAIVPVVLFHTGMPGFTGGFVGVDIFFVISGFLITRQLLREHAEGAFSLFAFWTRRARRIIPAIAVVVAFTLVAGWFLYLPGNYRDLGRSAAAQSIFISDIYFYFKAGYFTAPAETKPLLHTWSLSLEDQFYLLIPLLVWLFVRWRHPVRMRIIVGLRPLCATGAFVDEKRGFFLSDIVFKSPKPVCQ